MKSFSAVRRRTGVLVGIGVLLLMAGCGPTTRGHGGSNRVDLLKPQTRQSTLGKLASGIGNFAFNTIMPSEVKRAFAPRQGNNMAQITNQLSQIGEGLTELHELAEQLYADQSLDPSEREERRKKAVFRLATMRNHFNNLRVQAAMAQGVNYSDGAWESIADVFEDVGQRYRISSQSVKDLGKELEGRTVVYPGQGNPYDDPEQRHHRWTYRDGEWIRFTSPGEDTQSSFGMLDDRFVMALASAKALYTHTLTEKEAKDLSARGVPVLGRTGPRHDDGTQMYVFDMRNSAVRAEFFTGQEDRGPSISMEPTTGQSSPTPSIQGEPESEYQAISSPGDFNGNAINVAQRVAVTDPQKTRTVTDITAKSRLTETGVSATRGR